MRQQKQTQQPAEQQPARLTNATDRSVSPSVDDSAAQAQHATAKRRGPRPGTAAARRGGQAVAEKYGREFYSTIGAKGGRAAKEQLGLDFYASIGHRGGETTQKTYGKEHYARIGRIGGQHGKGRPKLRAADRQAMLPPSASPDAGASAAPDRG